MAGTNLCTNLWEKTKSEMQLQSSEKMLEKFKQITATIPQLSFSLFLKKKNNEKGKVKEGCNFPQLEYN